MKKIIILLTLVATLLCVTARAATTAYEQNTEPPTEESFVPVPVSEEQMEANYYFGNTEFDELDEPQTEANGLRIDNPTVRELKKRYDVSGYRKQPGDPYDPVWCAIASAVVPGIGQIICDKVGRGVLFFVGTAAPLAAAIATKKEPYINAYGFPEHDIAHTAALIGVTVIVWVWNVIDAAEIAILKDKHFRDSVINGAKLSVNPYFDLTPNPTGNLAPQVGLSLAVNF